MQKADRRYSGDRCPYQREKQYSSKLYSYNIIHKNYRNFYGMSKIYQLLDTGICDSLTGVTGAYSQMRTDQIIDNQEVNNELQKKILVSNQMMCTAMSQTNR